LVQAGVRINPVSFELRSADRDGIEAQVQMTRAQRAETIRTLQFAVKEPVVQMIAKAAELRQRGYLITALPGFPTPDLTAAWRCYEALSRAQTAVGEIRKLVFATQIVRGNAKL